MGHRGEKRRLERMPSDEIIVAVKDVIHSLAKGDYKTLEADGRAGRLSAEDLRDAVATYGRSLIIPPDEAWEEELLREAIPVGEQGNSWALVANLWTVGQGRSDLSLEATAEARPEGVLVSIDDLHVL